MPSGKLNFAVLGFFARVSKAINHTLGTPVIDSSATLVTDSTRLAFAQDLFHPVLIFRRSLMK